MSQHFQYYTLTSTLERHAASTTYLAVPDQKPTRSVVLKLFHDSGFTNASEQEKFLEETEKFSLLSNSPMVPIIEAGIENEQAYIVSEYMPNGSLRVRLDRAYPQRLPIQQAMIIIMQIGQGLAYLHARYMLHGQLKPEHILFTTNGRALLSDPYCATIPAPWDPDNENARDAYRYLAPEQFAGQNSPLSDQYALCCVAYELLTGRPPFTSREPQTLKEQQLRALPGPISPILPDLPTTIEQAILKGLAKEPTQRHTDIIAFLAALQSSKTATAPDLPLPRAMRRTRSLAPSIPIAPPIPPKPTKKPIERSERPALPQTSPSDDDIFATPFNQAKTPTPGVPNPAPPAKKTTDPAAPTPRAANPTIPTPGIPKHITPTPTNNPPRNNRPRLTASQPALSPDTNAQLKNVPDRAAATPSSKPLDPQSRNDITHSTAPLTNPPLNRIPDIKRPAPPTRNNDLPFDDIFDMMSASSSTLDDSQPLDDMLDMTAATPSSPAPDASQPFANIDDLSDATISLPQESADESFGGFMQELALEDLLRMLDQPARDSKPTTPFNIQPSAAETIKHSDYSLDFDNNQDLNDQTEMNRPLPQESTTGTFNDFLQELALEDEHRKVDKHAHSQPLVAPESQPAHYDSTPLIVPNSNLLSYDPIPRTASNTHLLQPAAAAQFPQSNTVTTPPRRTWRWKLVSRKTTIWTLALLLMIGSIVTYTAIAATLPKSSSLTLFNNLIHPTPKSTVDQLGILPSETATRTATTTTSSQTPEATSRPTPTATPETTLLYSNTVSTQAPTNDAMVLAFVPALTVTDTRIEGDIVIHGNTGGILFRSATKSGYSMRISTDGTYDLENASGSLTKGSSSAIKKGDNVSNHLTIIAKGDQITISINGKEIINRQDSSASSGKVGILAINSGKATTTNCTLNIYTS